MKKLIALILFFLIGGGIFSVSAQIIGSKIDWDNDIRAIRLNDIPHFRYKYDDYLQFSPAAAMIVMRACGGTHKDMGGTVERRRIFSRNNGSYRQWDKIQRTQATPR